LRKDLHNGLSRKVQEYVPKVSAAISSKWFSSWRST
jgi:hypothetical protein